MSSIRKEDFMTALRISDLTLRESELARGSDLSFREKLELAKLLERLGVDVIETGYVNESKAAAVTVRTIATTISRTILCCPVVPETEAIDRTWQALSQADRPRLNLIVPVSTVQMEYNCHLKAPAMLQKVAEMVSYCSELCPDVEFTADDATRAEPDFLRQVISKAIECGAKTVTIADPDSHLLPEEAGKLVADLYKDIPQLQQVVLSVRFKDDLHLASANALAAIQAGVGQLKTTVGGVHGNLSLEDLAKAVQNRSDALSMECGLDFTALFRTCQQISQLTSTEHLSGRSAFSTVPAAVEKTVRTEDEMVELDANSDLLTVRHRILALGYDLSEDDVERVYDRFCQIASKKKIDDRDLEALIAETSRQVAPTYILENYVINSGNAITATAFVRLQKSGERLESVSTGDGPIDAAFLAVNQMVGHHFELEDFQIVSVTEGREAMGDALVKLRHMGVLYSGRGLSTDIIGASIRAYLNAINKIVHEENLMK